MRETLSIGMFIGILGLSMSVHANPGLIAQSTASATTFESYRQECVRRSRGEGLALDVANDLCNCTLKKFQARYTLAQFRALVQKSKTDKTAANSLSSVGEACFDEVLYEN